MTDAERVLLQHLTEMSRFFKGLNPYWSKQLRELAREGETALLSGGPAAASFLEKITEARTGRLGLERLHVSAIPAREEFRALRERLYVLMTALGRAEVVRT